MCCTAAPSQVLEKIQEIPGFVFQHTNPSLTASTLIILHLFRPIITSTAALLNRFNWIKWCRIISVWTYWLLEEEHGQSSDKRHVTQQRLHHHSQHAVDLWQHKRNTLTYKHIHKRESYRELAPCWPSTLLSRVSCSTWQVRNSITAWLHTCLVSSSTFFITYYDNYKDYGIGSALHVSCGHHTAALIHAREQRMFKF